MIAFRSIPYVVLTALLALPLFAAIPVFLLFYLPDPDIFFWRIAIGFPIAASLLSTVFTLINVRRRGLPALATMKAVGDAINREHSEK
jgi:hypothetical protein